MPLDFVHSSLTSLLVDAPANSAIAPPGYYMLFVVSTTGRVSRAVYIKQTPFSQ